MTGSAKAATLSLRVNPELIERMRAASNAHPYKPSLTAIAERGIELALAELAENAKALKKDQP